MAAFQCLQPIRGTLLASEILQEHPILWHFGAGGVIAGLLIISKYKNSKLSAALPCGKALPLPSSLIPSLDDCRDVVVLTELR